MGSSGNREIEPKSGRIRGPGPPDGPNFGVAVSQLRNLVPNCLRELGSFAAPIFGAVRRPPRFLVPDLSPWAQEPNLVGCPCLVPVTLLVFRRPESGVARQPRNLGFVLANPAELQVSRSLLAFSVERSHASSSGKLTNVASTFSVVVQSRLLDIAE